MPEFFVEVLYEISEGFLNFFGRVPKWEGKEDDHQPKNLQATIGLIHHLGNN